VTLVDNRNTSDPYINLAIEEFLIRHADCSKQDFLLLYINEPCIVLGKNQSIYKEVNFEFLRNNQLHLCRRISGGGTVYQDKGNLSFSFISQFSENKINNYRLFNQPVVDALKRIGVDAKMDERNNILCNGKKISGNAQFTNRKNIISHGTLLFDADLNILRSCLKENEFKVESKAVSSVRSSVINLKDVTNKISTTEELKDYLKHELKASNILQFTDEEWNIILKSAEEKFKSFEWIYGRSPLTTITKDEVGIEVEQGIICEIRNMEYGIRNLVGVKYEFREIKRALENSKALDLLKSVF
jgi:lipoate-protein ligase A